MIAPFKLWENSPLPKRSKWEEAVGKLNILRLHTPGLNSHIRDLRLWQIANLLLLLPGPNFRETCYRHLNGLLLFPN